MTWNTLIVSTEGAVGIVRLNRPAAMNALNAELTAELTRALDGFEDDTSIGAIVITGGDTVFAAGADIKELRDKTFADVYGDQLITRTWERAARCRKPVIAAVAGHAIGGGCELALMADIVVADETARFALPETRIGTIPGAGGTQRLTRAVGKAAAMDMVLTGRMITAGEALRLGLVSRVVPAEHYFSEALNICNELSTKSPLALRLAKEAVAKAFDTSLSEGLEYERKLFYMLFATEDQKEGMRAFLEKRSPVFAGR